MFWSRNEPPHTRQSVRKAVLRQTADRHKAELAASVKSAALRQGLRQRQELL
jgi:hypothetical protein